MVSRTFQIWWGRLKIHFIFPIDMALNWNWMAINWNPSSILRNSHIVDEYPLQFYILMYVHCSHIYIYLHMFSYIYMYTHTRYILIISLVISHLCRRQRTCRRQGDHGFFIDSNGNGLAMDWVAVFFPLDVKDGNLSFSPIYILYTCIYTVYVYI